MALSNEDFKDIKKGMGAPMAKKVSRVTNDRVKQFEHAVDRGEREIVRNRRAQIKAGGFKNESDYFTNAHPFKDYTRDKKKDIASKMKPVARKMMVKKPTGGMMRVGSRTHRYWDDIRKRGEQDKKYGGD